MNTDYEFHLMQFADSLFPSGLFSMSSGFESWSKFHGEKSAKSVLEFIRQQITLQVAPLDCVVLKKTMDAADAHDVDSLVALDDFYYSTKCIKETRNATVRSGRQIIECVHYMLPATDLPRADTLDSFRLQIQKNETRGTYPVSLGLCLSCLGIPHDAAVRMLLYSFCSGIVASAIRLGVIGHLDGQKIITRVSRMANEIVPALKSKTLDDAWQMVPLAEILQMNHEYDESKMFIT